MPMFNVSTERIEDFQYQIQTFGERADQLNPVLEDITDKILDRNRRAFESRGATTGTYWRPLQAATVKRKESQGAPHPLSPLRRTDTLMKSLSMRGGGNQIINVDDEGLYIATTLDYAQFHNRDTGRPPFVVPAKHAHEYIGMLNDFIFGEGDYA